MSGGGLGEAADDAYARRLEAVVAGHRGEAAVAERRLSDSDAAVRAAALGALARCGELQVAQVRQALEDEAAAVRCRAAELAPVEVELVGLAERSGMRRWWRLWRRRSASVTGIPGRLRSCARLPAGTMIRCAVRVLSRRWVRLPRAWMLTLMRALMRTRARLLERAHATMLMRAPVLARTHATMLKRAPVLARARMLIRTQAPMLPGRWHSKSCWPPWRTVLRSGAGRC